MTYGEWLANQTRIYNEIRESGRTATLFVPDPVAQAEMLGYLVAYVFPSEIEKEVARVAAWYHRYLPVMGFGPGSVHSTLLDFQVQAGGIDFRAEASQAVFRQLAEQVQAGVTEAGCTGGAILYDEILHRDTTVVARGVPNYALWNLSEAVYRHCRKTFAVRRGWGAHITVARVTEPTRLAVPLPVFPLALGEVKPDAILVGTLDLRECRLLAYERFPLS